MKIMQSMQSMQSMKIVSKLAIIAIVAGFLVGCASQATPNENPNNQKEDTITIVDAYGNKVEVGEVNKAVIFDFGILDIMDNVDVDVELALPVASLPTYLSQYKDAVSAGSIKEPNLEAIFEFEPDVIIISTRQASFYDQLSEIAPTIFLDLNAAKFMDDFKRNAEVVGTLFDKQAEIAAGIAQIDTLVKETKQLASTVEEKALIILTNDGSISAYGSGSRFGLIHDVLGLKQADEGIVASTHGQEASFEYISQINPDFLFVVDRTQVVGGSTLGNSTLDNELVNSTNASKNNNIVFLDPEAWYISAGGFHSVKTMVSEVKAAIE